MTVIVIMIKIMMAMKLLESLGQPSRSKQPVTIKDEGKKDQRSDNERGLV